jgi:CRP-like cAMP-binding protein
MRNSLFILGQLTDSDVEWLARRGTQRRLVDGEVLVYHGHAVDSVFITLAGQFVVKLHGGREVARLGVGEVIGEIAFVDSSPPSATVSARGESLVLVLAKAILEARLAEDDAFAARFYRALAIFLADRLRATTRRLGNDINGDLVSRTPLQDELDIEVLDTLSQAGERFTRLLQILGGRDPEVPPKIAGR